MTLRWEYMVVEHDVATSELNKNGARGWELVSVVNREGALNYFFKRAMGDAERSDDPADRARSARAQLKELRES